MRRGLTAIEVLVVIAIIVVVLCIGINLYQSNTGSFAVGKEVRLKINNRRGTVLDWNGNRATVNYADDNGNIYSAEVLQSQMEPWSEP